MASPKFSEFVSSYSKYIKKQFDLPSIAWGSSEYLLNKVRDGAISKWKSEGYEVNSWEGHQWKNINDSSITGQQGLFAKKQAYIISHLAQQKMPCLKVLLKNQKANKQFGSPLLVLVKEEKLSKTVGNLTNGNYFGIPCFAPRFQENFDFVASMAKKHKLHISSDAIHRILASSDDDLYFIENTIKHWSLIYKDQGNKPKKDQQTYQISGEDAAFHLGMMRGDNVFQIKDLILSRKWNEAQILAKSLTEDGYTLLINSILARLFRDLITVKSLPNKNPRAVSTTLRLPFNIGKKYCEQASDFSAQSLSQALDLCCELDICLKTSRIHEGVYISRIIESLSTN